MKRVLAVGGTDSGGGAGLAADLRTLAALGVHGAMVVTAVTAQSSLAVEALHEVPEAVVRAQLAAVLGDLGADVVKTGMLASGPVVVAVVEAVMGRPLVVDPVGVSSSGQSLLTPEGLALLRSELLPLALVVTPNLAEVLALTGFAVASSKDLLEAARRVHALGPAWVLVKGGHLPGAPVDLLWDGTTSLELVGERVATPHTHGTGCTQASALAAHLALGWSVPDAATAAKAFVTRAVKRGYAVGAGPGPVRQV